MSRTIVTLAMMFSLLLAGCGGGGGSDSSSAGGSASGSMVFNGTETVTVTFKGTGQSNTSTFSLTIVISGNAITITDTDGTRYSGNVTGNTFTASGVQELGDVAPGVRCGNITITYSGTISGNQITGNSEGASPCDTSGGRITTTQKGTFSVSA